MKRLHDWPERLVAYIESHRATPFAYGPHDCVRFAAGAVHAVTGVDVLQSVQWSDLRTAVQLLRAHGGLAGAVDSVLPRLQTPALAQRGDIVLLTRPGAAGTGCRWLAVCEGARAWSPTRFGLAAWDMTAASVAWEVGHG